MLVEEYCGKKYERGFCERFLVKVIKLDKNIRWEFQPMMEQDNSHSMLRAGSLAALFSGI